MNIIVTGCGGFIGSNFVRNWLKDNKDDFVFGIDKFTYAARMANLKGIEPKSFSLLRMDIKDVTLEQMEMMKPTLVFNFAANSHVDNSILDSSPFVDDNVKATVCFLETCRRYYDRLEDKRFLFQQISTDEVYGALKEHEPSFTEKSLYLPNSPYSASKAASDHFVRAFNVTYGLPTVITHCSNNYGPRQHPEKLIPKVIQSCIVDRPIPVYGQGQQIRDWIHVDDHCDALALIAREVFAGCQEKVFNIGGDNEVRNIDLVKLICKQAGVYVSDRDCEQQIVFVQDRLGHDFRYSIDSSLMKSLGWKPQWNFEEGIRATVRWYAEELV